MQCAIWAFFFLSVLLNFYVWWVTRDAKAVWLAAAERLKELERRGNEIVERLSRPVWICSCGLRCETLADLEAHAKEAGGLLHGDRKEPDA
jgi:hypothetical protein